MADYPLLELPSNQGFAAMALVISWLAAFTLFGGKYLHNPLITGN
jgi:hypothetical protein